MLRIPPRVVLSLSTLVTLAAAGCADLISDPAVPAADGLVLSIDASPREIAPGDTVQIVARLKNTNPHEITLTFASGCQILHYVEDARKRRVEPRGSGWMCTGALTSLRIGAGQTETRAFVWTGEQVVGRESGSWTPVHERLPPGRYWVHATLVDAEARARRIALRTPPIEVTLR